MTITNCKTNHLINPLGFALDTVAFSYTVEHATGSTQTAARIVVTQGGETLADTGFCADINPLGQAVALPLQPCTRYHWTVTVQTDAGEEATSEQNWFETGKQQQLWQASWITCQDKDEARHPIFGKCFAAEGQLTSARLYICGLGLYTASLNGKSVTDECLTPYFTNYADWVQYQTYDVTALVAAQNSIEVTLGNGWYKGRFGHNSRPNDAGHYGDSFKLIAELHLTFADGSKQLIKTDESWNVTRSNITFSNIYDGEHRDDTLSPVLAQQALLLPDEEAKTLHLTERLSTAVTTKERLQPIALLQTPAGEQVFDVGQNMAGGFRLKVHEPKGTQIRLQFGDVLQNDNFYRDNLRSAAAEYRYISDGEPHVLQPVFTFYGYRYAKVEGASSLSAEDFEALVYYSDVPGVSSLVTGHSGVNQLLSNIQWGQKGNFIDLPTDCPQRDERMGWTADTQVFVPTAAYLTDNYAFYRKYLRDLRSEQAAFDGLVPQTVPSLGTKSTSSVWGDAATIMPWMLYEYYGDESILHESYQSMADWVEYMRRIDGDDFGWRRVFHFGDWLALDHPNKKPDETAGGTEEAYISDVYFYNSICLVAKAAGVLGKTQDEKQYQALAETHLAKIRNEYFTANGRCAIATQTGFVLALYYGLSPVPQRTIEQLKLLLKKTDYKMQTGFVGTPLLLKVLSQMGEDEIAYRILKNEDYPGWLYAVNLGATTVWERWNSMNPDGSVSSTGMNSFNHYAYGAVGEWIWQTAAGISPCGDAPGFQKAILRPVPNYDLRFVRAEYASPAGCYRVAWEVLDADHVHLSVTVPFGCTAQLLLPYAADTEPERSLASGTFELTYRTKQSLKEILTVDSTIAVLLDNEASSALLKKVVPQITQLPAQMRGMAMRQVMMRMGGDAAQSEPQAPANAIHPGKIWRDTNGVRIQAHGGALFFENDTYYWYGENKNRTDGVCAIWTWGIRAYSSKDLYNWTDLGLIIPPDFAQTESGLYPEKHADRPHIVKCDATGKYVCWIKQCSTEACFVILQADAFAGPYTVVAEQYRPMGMKVGDFDIVKDEATGNAYLFMDGDHAGMVGLQLSADYCSAQEKISLQYEGLHAPFCREAPAVFQRKDKFYMLTSGMTGYVPNKSDAAVADSLTQTFASIGNPHPTDASNSSFNSQISQVFKVPNKQDLYIAIADRWVPEFVVDARIADIMERSAASHYDPERYRVTPEEQQEAMNSPMLESANTSVADYVWLPLVFEGDVPTIAWRESWRLDEFE